MIAGYRGTGKDTLHTDLRLGNIVFRKGAMPVCDYSWIPIWIMFLWQMILLWTRAFVEFIGWSLSGYPHRDQPKWYVFANRKNAIRACQEYLFVTTDRQQTAFARELKRQVHEKINHAMDRKEQVLTDEWFEKNKEHRLKIGKEMTTPRELYIAMGEAAKRKDPIIWARKCFKSFAARPHPWPLGNVEIIDITDWRFRSEQIYANFHDAIYKIFTTRIYRSEVIAPNTPSEHDLDLVTTDLLLVTSQFEMIFALIRWPQYSRHTLIGELQHSA